jgi:hypothetical protein
MWIVFEMLDRLDKHYIEENGRSIFSVPNLKWFDPASGMGNFPVGVYMRLMEGLKTVKPDAEERKRHIIENMLYMSELNAKNVFICREIFNGDKYEMNIHDDDTLNMNENKLSEKFKSVLKDGFDVVMGNPPFNKGGIKSFKGDKIGDGMETIWPEFIKNSLNNWLKTDGYLVFINPLSWLKKSHSMHTMMLEKRTVWLKLWDDIKSKNMINASIPISLYILKNTKNDTNKKTEIISELQNRKLTISSNEYLNPKYTIPLAFHSIFNKLYAFIEKENCVLEYKTKTVKSSGVKTKIPINYTNDDMWGVDTYTLKEGVLVKKTTEKHPDMEKRKLIISNKRGFRGAFIDEGKLGLTGNHKFYILGGNLELIQKMTCFGIIDIICDFTKYGQAFLDNSAFTYIPDLRKLGGIIANDITEDKFYVLIGLTNQEIEMIRNFK